MGGGILVYLFIVNLGAQNIKAMKKCKLLNQHVIFAFSNPSKVQNFLFTLPKIR